MHAKSIDIGQMASGYCNALKTVTITAEGATIGSDPFYRSADLLESGVIAGET